VQRHAVARDEALARVHAAYVDNTGTMNQTIIYGVPVAPVVSTTAAMVGIRDTF
jgi:hypothetical protein